MEAFNRRFLKGNWGFLSMCKHLSPRCCIREKSVLEHVANTKPLRWCSARYTTEIGVESPLEYIKNINIHIAMKYIKFHTQYT